MDEYEQGDRGLILRIDQIATTTFKVIESTQDAILENKRLEKAERKQKQQALTYERKKEAFEPWEEAVEDWSA